MKRPGSPGLADACHPAPVAHRSAKRSVVESTTAIAPSGAAARCVGAPAVATGAGRTRRLSTNHAGATTPPATATRIVSTYSPGASPAVDHRQRRTPGPVPDEDSSATHAEPFDAAHPALAAPGPLGRTSTLSVRAAAT